MAGEDPEVEKFVKRICSLADAIERNTDEVVPKVFIAIANRVITLTPLWSGQARLNWTAHVGKSPPPKRFVNVPRKNTRLRKSKGIVKLSDPRQGDFNSIERDPRVYLLAKSTAMFAVRRVAKTYTHPGGKSAAPKLFLSNSISYIHDLWSGTWRTNPNQLQKVVTDIARGPISTVRIFRGA